MNIDSIVKQIFGKLKVVGGTDGTVIGNTGDRLKVDVGTTGQVVISDTQNKTFCVLARDIVIGNNKSMFCIVNGAESSAVIKLREIRLINVQNNAVTGVNANFQLNRVTGCSGGSILTPSSHDTSDSLSGSVTSYTGATASGEGSILQEYRWSSDDWAAGSSDVESADHTSQSLIPFYVVQPYTKPITLRAGEGIHIKQTVNSTNGAFTVMCIFTEESA